VDGSIHRVGPFLPAFEAGDGARPDVAVDVNIYRKGSDASPAPLVLSIRLIDTTPGAAWQAGGDGSFRKFRRFRREDQLASR
jgi:hypothetical protein